MMIGVYLPRGDREHADALTAMAIGIHAAGDGMAAVNLDEFNESHLYDAAVVFGVRQIAVPKSELRGRVYDAYRKAGKNVLVIEKGYVRRNEYYAAGWNGLNGRADFRNKNVGGDRWRDLGIELKSYRKSKDLDCILIAGQVPWDASVQDTDHLSWIAQTICVIDRVTAREIVVRPHPMARQHTPHYLGASRSDGDLSEALNRAHAVVTYNSNVGVDATIAGIPVFCADEGSMVYDIANHDLGKIEMPEHPDRESWAARIAYAQWSLEEMKQGLAWQHLRDGVHDAH